MKNIMALIIEKGKILYYKNINIPFLTNLYQFHRPSAAPVNNGHPRHSNGNGNATRVPPPAGAAPGYYNDTRSLQRPRGPTGYK